MTREIHCDLLSILCRRPKVADCHLRCSRDCRHRLGHFSISKRHCRDCTCIASPACPSWTAPGILRAAELEIGEKKSQPCKIRYLQLIVAALAWLTPAVRHYRRLTLLYILCTFADLQIMHDV
jgi:hypothetical protein